MSRVRSLAWLAIAATPAVAHASSTPVAPNFSCNAEDTLSAINWGNLGSHSISVTEVLQSWDLQTGTGGPTAPAPTVTTDFGCGLSSSPSVTLSNGQSFSITFGELNLANYKLADGLSSDFNYSITPSMNSGLAASKDYVTDFDLYIHESYSETTSFGVNSSSATDFIGVEVRSKDGSSLSDANSFSFANNVLTLDPPIANGGTVTVSLYRSPRVVATPEPTSLMMLGSGLLGIASILRRRKR